MPPILPRPHPQPRIVFGAGGDIKPLSLTVSKDHCAVLVKDEAATAEGEGGVEGDGADKDGKSSSSATYTLECGEGETYLNGR